MRTTPITGFDIRLAFGPCSSLFECWTDEEVDEWVAENNEGDYLAFAEHELRMEDIRLDRQLGAINAAPDDEAEAERRCRELTRDHERMVERVKLNLAALRGEIPPMTPSQQRAIERVRRSSRLYDSPHGRPERNPKWEIKEETVRPLSPQSRVLWYSLTVGMVNDEGTYAEWFVRTTWYGSIGVRGRLRPSTMSKSGTKTKRRKHPTIYGWQSNNPY